MFFTSRFFISPDELIKNESLAAVIHFHMCVSLTWRQEQMMMTTTLLSLLAWHTVSRLKV